MSVPYTILVNSTDSFEDTWQPFFTLFKEFWPEYTQTIVLNTETKDFSFPGLKIRCSRVGTGKKGRQLTWSECLANCLDSIDNEVILYLQDDYFLNQHVDTALVNEFALLVATGKCSHVSLVPFSNSGPWKPTDHPLLWEVDQKAGYRISMQAGLWRVSALRRYLRKHENAWQLEVWGTKRAHRIKDTFFTINRDIFKEGGRQVIPYIPTGIVKGKWYRDAVYELFKRHGINIDFEQRGFYDSTLSTNRRAPLLKRVVGRIRSLI